MLVRSGSVPREAAPAAAPSLHSRKSTDCPGAAQASGQTPGCPPRSQRQALTRSSLVQDWRKIVSQKSCLKNVEKIHTPSVCRVGAGSPLDGLPAREEILWSSCEGAGKEYETPAPRGWLGGEETRTLCLSLSAGSWRHRGSGSR